MYFCRHSGRDPETRNLPFPSVHCSLFFLVFTPACGVQPQPPDNEMIIVFSKCSLGCSLKYIIFSLFHLSFQHGFGVLQMQGTSAKAYYCYVERAVTKQIQCIRARMSEHASEHAEMAIINSLSGGYAQFGSK